MMLTATRGTALIHQQHAGWIPWAGDISTNRGGAVIADREGSSTAYALDNLQKRVQLFIGSGEDVYEGMIFGENSRPEEMTANPTKPKQLTNIRAVGSDETVKLTPPRRLTLETAIEWIGEDELVEVTPKSVRVRKRFLSDQERRLSAKKKR
jgi:GTP-binding protein